MKTATATVLISGGLVFVGGSFIRGRRPASGLRLCGQFNAGSGTATWSTGKLELALPGRRMSASPSAPRNDQRVQLEFRLTRLPGALDQFLAPSGASSGMIAAIT